MVQKPNVSQPCLTGLAWTIKNIVWFGSPSPILGRHLVNLLLVSTFRHLMFEKKAHPLCVQWFLVCKDFDFEVRDQRDVCHGMRLLLDLSLLPCMTRIWANYDFEEVLLESRSRFFFFYFRFFLKHGRRIFCILGILGMNSSLH